MSQEVSTKKHAFLNFLLLGALSMLYAEIGSGSSQLWFLNPFMVLYTFVLYGVHVLFYLNVAIKTRRTSVLHLYFWGMLFALYEAPITQVLWSGYTSEQGPLWGTFAGIAWQEFITLVFFWHPVMSFILPVLTVEVFILDQGKDHVNTQNVLPNHMNLLRRIKQKKTWVMIYIIFLATGELMSTGINVMISVISLFGSMLIAFFFYVLLKKQYDGGRNKKRQWSIYSFELSKKGFILLTIFILIYVYGLGTFLLSKELPGRFPRTWIGYVSMSLVVIFVLSILWLIPKNEVRVEEEIKSKKRGNPPSEKAVFALWGEWLLMTLILGFIPGITFIIGVAFYVLNFLFGIVLFVFSMYKLIQKFNKTHE